MAEAKGLPHEKKVYRVKGFTCANCASTFEKNVKNLNGVDHAQVNFGASKITVYGETSIQNLEKAGAFENLKVTPENDQPDATNGIKESFLKKHLNVLLAVLFLTVGITSHISNGEGNAYSMIAYATSMVIGGYALFKVGFMNLLRLQFDMKTLMTVAVIGAAIIGEWLEGSIVVILFAISEALERFSMDKARQSIRSLMDIAPKEALIRREGQEMLIRVNEIQIGDIMIVKPGQKIAMDGIIVNGYSSVNQAAITGESVPVEKGKEDEVFAGTLNAEGMLEIEVTKHVDDTTIAKIIHLVEEAQGERAPAQAFVDRFARYYTPAIMVAATLLAIIPPLLFQANWEMWIYQGLAVLVVGCPCALVISTPVSIVTAIGNAAKHGVLVKGGIYLEELGGLQAIAFDKTGTLTKGEPVVTDFRVHDAQIAERDLLSIVTALEYHSQHPLASAVLKKAEQEQIAYESTAVDHFTSIIGKGIQGVVHGTTYYIGSPKLFADTLELNVPARIKEEITKLQEQGKTVMVIGTKQAILGILAVADEVRESSQGVIEQLHELGIKTVMLTGDHQSTATAIGKQVGVTDVRAELLPQDKLDVIKQLRAEYEQVAMVGDGVNDAPALAASTVGIAMGGAGTDTALETADAALMGDDLSKLPFTMRLSRKALAIIKQNITFSLGIKAFALLLVIPGWLTLWIAILSDLGATLLVTLNGMRLIRVKEKEVKSK